MVASVKLRYDYAMSSYHSTLFHFLREGSMLAPEAMIDCVKPHTKQGRLTSSSQ